MPEIMMGRLSLPGGGIASFGGNATSSSGNATTSGGNATRSSGNATTSGGNATFGSEDNLDGNFGCKSKISNHNSSDSYLREG